MGAVPKRRISHSRKNNKRSHHRVELPTLIDCPHCKNKMVIHHACTYCGKYKNKVILPI